MAFTGKSGEEVDDANGAVPVGTISREEASSEDGFVVTMYCDGDAPAQRYEELRAALVVEAATLDSEQWIDGYFNVGEYIIEACLVGIYNRVEVLATVVNRDTGETVVEYFDEDADEVVAERRVIDE